MKGKPSYFLMIFLLVAGWSFAQRTLTVENVSTTCGASDVIVNVFIDDTTDLVSFQFDLFYDTTYLTYVSANATALLSGWFFQANEPNPGQISIAGASGTPLGAGTNESLCEIHFSVASVTPDPYSTLLDIQNAQVGIFGAGNQAANMVDGNMDVSCACSTAPAAFNLLSPADGAVDQPTALTLDWEDAGTPPDHATAYDLYLGTTSPPPLYQADITTSDFAVSGLALQTTYYWYVVAKNNCGSTNSATWSFTTTACTGPPGAFNNLSPADGAVDQPLNLTLDWEDATEAGSYDVYLDTVTPPATLYAADVTTSQLDLVGLNPSTTYYWQVVAKNPCGNTSGTIWSFTTVPNELYLGDATGQCGLTVDVPVDLAVAAGVMAFSFDLPYDNTVITFAGVTATDPDFTITPTDTGTQVTIDASSATGFDAGGTTVCILTFNVDPSAVNNTTTSLVPANVVVDGNSVPGYPGTITFTCQPGTGPAQEMRVSSTVGTCGQDVEVLVSVDSLDGLQAFQFDLYFDTTYLTVSSVVPVLSDMTLIYNTFADHLSVAAAMATPHGPGMGAICKIIFTPVFGNYGLVTLPLDLQNPYVNTWAVTDIDGVLKLGCTCDGAVDEFTYVSPADQAVDVPLPVTLTWTAAPYADYYKVYLGMEPNSLSQVDMVTSTSYTADGLAPHTTYYWQIIAANACSSYVGPVWSFTTGEAPAGQPATLYAAVAASTTGARATYWQTDVRIINKDTLSANFTITFVPSEADGLTEYYTYSDTLEPKAVWSADDILASVFGLSEAYGALRIESDRVLGVSTRTYTKTENGSYGQFVKAVKADKAIALRSSKEILRQGDVGYLFPLTNTADFRTNIGFMEVTGNPVEVTITYYDKDGNLLQSLPAYALKAYSHHQEFALSDFPGQEDAYATLSVSGDGAIVAYLTYIDNHTGDPTFALAQKVMEEKDYTNQHFPVVVKAPGANNTYWTTSMTVFNPYNQDEDVTFILHTPTGSISQVQTVEAKRVFSTANLLEEFFPDSGEIATSFEVQSSLGVLALARVYTPSEEGTMGFGIAPLLTEDLMNLGDVAYTLHLEQDTDFRSNVGLSEFGNKNAVMRIDVYNTDGQLLGTKGWGLPGLTHVQFNELLKSMGLDPLEDGYLKISLVNGDGMGSAYLTVIDNHSGDASYVPAE